MRILNDRYIDIELNEYIQEKKELKDSYNKSKNESIKQNLNTPFDHINYRESSIYHHNINDTMISSQQKLKLSREANEERELLITGFCRYLIPKQINHDIFTSSIETYLLPLSCKTQRAIFSADFIAQIINNFQSKNECPFIKKNRDKINLLDYIYVRGGALRDIILHRDINDIDIVIDTNQLTKRYYYHLKKYHSEIDRQSVHCNCYLWQRYLNIYKEPPYESSNFWEINAEQDPLKKFESNIVKCPFLLNAVFIKDIIIKSMYNNSILNDSMQAINTWGYTNWVLNINKSIKYRNIDLNGARFDIGDQMSLSDGMGKGNKIINVDMMKQCKSWNKYFHFLFCLHSPLFYGIRSMEKDRTSEEKEIINELKQNYDNIENGGINNELISIHLPDYSFYMRYSTQFCDFTINGIRLPLSSIINDNNFNWYSKIMDYSYSNNVDNILYLGHNRMSIKNIENKIIKQPHLNVLSLEFVYNDYFWRFIKLLSKFAFYIYNGSWNIDKNTLSNIRKSFKLHFKRLDTTKIGEFLNRLLIWDISRETDIYQFEKKISSRFMIFKIIDLEKYLIDAFKKNRYFVQYLRSYKIGRLGDDKLKIIYKVLKECGYKSHRNESFEIIKVGSKPYQVPDSYIDPIYEMNYYQHVWLYYRVYTQIKEHGKRKTLISNNYVKKKWNNNHNKRSPVQIKWKKKKKLKKKKSKRQEFNVFIKKGNFY